MSAQLSMPPAEPCLSLAVSQDGRLRVVFSGRWNIESPPPDTAPAARALERKDIALLELAADGLEAWDSSLLAVAIRLMRSAQARGIPCALETLPLGVRNLIRLTLAVPPNTGARKNASSVGLLAAVGAAAVKIPAVTASILAFLGDLTLSFGRFFAGRAACSPRDLLLAIQECGAEALPIVSLISMLVGFILAFVGVVQLRMFGAEIYVSSFVAIGMTRIMGAIMVGIIMAGRTGASFAATIGAMQVNEEVDALSTLGISPSDNLVLPRVIALTITTPMLVLYADLMGILGGFIVGVGMLGLDPMEYFTFTKMGFMLKHLWIGVTHGFVFGALIAITGCYQGLHCGRNAAAVGKAVTSAVVYSIVGIVISTSIITVLCNIMDI